MKRAERQDGLRRLVTLTAETDDDIEALVKLLPGCTMEGRLEVAERLARRVLADAGLPTEAGRYRRYNDGRIEVVPDDAQQEIFDHVIYCPWPRRPPPSPVVDTMPDPDGWTLVTLADLAGPAPSLTNDAAMVLGFAAAVRRALAGGVEPVELARRVARFTEHFEALRLSIANGWRLADAGLRARKGASLGGRSREAMPHENRAAYADAMARAGKRVAAGLRINKSEVATHVANAHKLSVGTVRGWLKPLPDPHRQTKLASKAPSRQK
jgi:hypothetical protein